MEELWPQWLSDEEVRRLPVTREAYRERMKQIKAEALRTLRDRIFRNPEFEDDIRVFGSTVEEWMNQPYRHGAYKNEMLLHIGEVLQKARYLGWKIETEAKQKRGVLRSHLFEIRVLGDRSWIIVHEGSDGTMKLYSISDGEKVLEGVKKGSDLISSFWGYNPGLEIKPLPYCKYTSKLR